MFQKLVSHNADIRRLVDKGYAVGFDSNYMIVRDIPYLDDKGQLRNGAIVTKLEQEKQELVSAAKLAKLYNLSISTVRAKLIAINQGTSGKHMYNPELARQILTRNETNKRGRKRAN